MTKYYWQFSAEEDGVPIFMITPKDYFIQEGVLDDQFEGDDDLPDGFNCMCESFFEYSGTKEEAEEALNKNPLFEHFQMFSNDDYEEEDA